MRLQVVTFTVLAAIATSAYSTDIQPGLWQLALETRIAATSDFLPAPYTIDQCLTVQDAQDPSRVLGSTANPGSSDCTYTEKIFAGSRFSFKMRCAGFHGFQASGEVTYSATSMEGNIISTMNVAGEASELKSRIVAHRLGGCQHE